MAGIKDSFSKGLTTINVKTSNFMEENKLKTSIATQEAEIEKLKREVGTVFYKSWENGAVSTEAVLPQLEAIGQKYAVIAELRKQIDELSYMEKQILGGDTRHVDGSGVMFCAKCGAQIKAGSKFCIKCGNKVAEG